MLVSMWMIRELTTVDADTTIAAAARLMTRRRIRRLPVVEATAHGPRLVGIVSSTDLYRAFPADVNPFAADVPDCEQTHAVVGHVMHRDPQSIAPDAPLEAAAVLMRDRKIGALPVVRDGRLLGLITESDIFRAFVSVLAPAEGVTRVTCDVREGVDAFAACVAAAGRRRVRLTSLLDAPHDGHRTCVVHARGGNLQGFLDDLWHAGCRVLAVIAADDATDPKAPRDATAA